MSVQKAPLGFVLVMRADEPPAVPSRMVKCRLCRSDCWISRETGMATILAALELAEAYVFLCETCFDELVRGAERAL